jgi:hypothetical protein
MQRHRAGSSFQTDVRIGRSEPQLWQVMSGESEEHAATGGSTTGEALGWDMSYQVGLRVTPSDEMSIKTLCRSWRKARDGTRIRSQISRRMERPGLSNGLRHFGHQNTVASCCRNAT